MPREKDTNVPDGIELDEIEFVDDSEIGEIESLDLGELGTDDEPVELEVPTKPKKRKPVYTYEAVHGEKSIRKKFKDGVFQNYEVTISYGRKEVFDEKRNGYRRKEFQERKSFVNLDDAILWRNEHQNEKIEAKQKKVARQKYGITFKDAAREYYKEMEKQAEAGVIAKSYLNQLRIQNAHFEKYFQGERTTYIKSIDTALIQKYFEYEADNGMSRNTIVKYKTHLKAIWDFLKNDSSYGIKVNVVEPAKIKMKKTKYKATALKYFQLEELLREACKLEDPTFLYIVVFSMTQGLRRGELCGLMWGDIDFDTKIVTIRHNRVQLSTSETLKLPKLDKVRKIELHKLGYDTIMLYREWQENILGRSVKSDEFVMQWEINLIQDYVCHTGKVSRKWKEIYAQINKKRKAAEKEEIPYGRIHDGKHTYVTLAIQGVMKADGKIVPPASFVQVFQSAGHSLPKSMQNMSTTIYNEDIDTRWDVTRFWNALIEVNISEVWKAEQENRKEEYLALTEFERAKRRAQKEKRLEKAKRERLKGNPPEDILVEYEE